jgi:hypothetical protein
MICGCEIFGIIKGNAGNIGGIFPLTKSLEKRGILG